MHQLFSCEISRYILQNDLDDRVTHPMTALGFLKKRCGHILFTELILLLEEALGEGRLAHGYLPEDLNGHFLGLLQDALHVALDRDVPLIANTTALTK